METIPRAYFSANLFRSVVLALFFSPLLSFLQPVLLPTLSSFFPIGLWLLAIFPGKGNIISAKSSNFVRPGQDLQNGTCGRIYPC